MAVIDANDVATAIGRPISDENEQEQVEQWIADVEMLIGARLGDLDDLDQSLLAYVEREVVISRMRHRSEESDTSARTDTGTENYFLRVLDPWWALLSPATRAGSTTGSVRLTSALTR